MKSVYIIAEAGQNHNGELKMAKQLIDIAAMPIMDKAFIRQLPGVNAIKFTKRDLSEELTLDAANKIYDSPHAFGKTYGEHRKKLELDYEDHIELFHYAKDKELEFIETLTSPKTLRLINKIDIDKIKVASRDLTNIPLLEEIAKTRKPIILSTGMGGIPEIDRAVEIINKYHDSIVILHCISQYPADYSNLNLNSIPFLKSRYPYTIGYSDHSIGIVAPVFAIALGAEYIEKHITINHALKGSDHAGSLEPEGLWRMVRDIRNMEMSLGEFGKNIPDAVIDARIKLERSLCTRNKIQKGQILAEKDLAMLSPGGGFSWADKDRFIGKHATIDIDELVKIEEKMFR